MTHFSQNLAIRGNQTLDRPVGTIEVGCRIHRRRAGFIAILERDQMCIRDRDYFQKAAIGGKDSMSGTFNDKHVVPTLISFACSDAKTNNIITPQLKTCLLYTS